jgi:hypothetical protein
MPIRINSPTKYSGTATTSLTGCPFARKIFRLATIHAFWHEFTSAHRDDQLTTLYEIRPRKDHRGVDLISDALPFGPLWYGEQNAVSNAIGYAEFYSRSHDAVIRVYGAAGNVIERHEHAGDFKDW